MWMCPNRDHYSKWVEIHWNWRNENVFVAIETFSKNSPRNWLRRTCVRKDRSCVRALVSQPINASCPHSGWPIKSKVARSCASCRLPASRFTLWFGVSPIPLCLTLSSTPPCFSLLIHSLSLQPTLNFSLSGVTAYPRGDWRILVEISVHRYKV